MSTPGRVPMAPHDAPSGAGAERERHRGYVVRLYVGGNGSRSTIAVQLVKDVCEENLASDYNLEVIDLHQQLPLAGRDGIVAVPTLVKHLPAPSRRVVGNLTRERVLAGLELT